MHGVMLTGKPLGRWAKWGRVGGAACVAFFLVKGLVWLGIFAAAALHVLTL